MSALARTGLVPGTYVLTTVGRRTGAEAFTREAAQHPVMEPLPITPEPP